MNAPWFDGRTFRPNPLAMEILSKTPFVCSPIDASGRGVRLWNYRGGVYQPDGESEARRLAHETLGEQSKPDRIQASVDLIKETVKTEENALNTKALELVNVENGMLDWRERVLYSHQPEYRSTFQIRATYNATASLERIDQFLAEVFPPDALMLVEELLGYLLLPTTGHQKAFMLLGEGANGKSTFLKMLCAFLGEENVSNVSLQRLVMDKFAAAAIQGKLANVYADIPSSGLEQTDVFKAVVGGDTINAERKFGQPFKLRPTARLIFSANELPRSKDLTPAFFRRWVVIPFPNKFEGAKADRNLDFELHSPIARCALLNRALAGLRRLEAAQGFTDCASVREASQQYRLQCDSALEFINARLEADTLATVSKQGLYEGYQTWCVSSGLPTPAGQRDFNSRLTATLKVTEGREDGKRVWRGLQWRTE